MGNGRITSLEVGHKNQKAHEVTRDVTAWAGWVIVVAPKGVYTTRVWYRTDSLGNLLWAWARLDPLSQCAVLASSSTDRRLVATVSAATAHPMGWPSGFPTGRPWGFAFPGPVPRIGRPIAPLPERLGCPGPDDPT